ncbi:MAG: hypothetical protein J6330_08990 [Clostridia bacterium]|nr:hypothetical protein [Clostridia bacterium]
MDKIRVLFPYVEAGFGHIMPMKSLEQTFRKKYGDRVEIISSEFYTETGDKHLAKYEQMLANQVRIYNSAPIVGYIATGSCEFFGSTLSSFASMRLIAPIACRRGIKRMRELAPDVVIDTHWATHYYAVRIKPKPLTVMYCPDAQLNKLFEYNCDLVLISMPKGYEKGMRKRRFNEDNLKLVPFLIRNEAFDVCRDKKQLRRDLGLPEDKFTVLLVEGAYGIGKIEETTKLLIKEHIPMTVIPVCGTNTKLYERMQSLEASEEVTFRPYAFADNMLELHAASDVFCGKSGNMLAEATFYGNPSIITHFANLIERNIADHYLNTVGCAIKEFSPKKAVELIKRFAQDESLLEPYRRAAADYSGHFGSEEAADVIWQSMTERFPSLR